MTISEWQKVAWLLMEKNGFHEDATVHRGLLLTVGELCEAQNELRAGHFAPEVYFNGGSSKPEGFGPELADVVLRVLDLAETVGVNLEACIEQKHAYNLTRPYKHGKTF